MSRSVYPYLCDLWVCVLEPGLHNAWMFLLILSVCLFVSKLEHVLVGMVERNEKSMVQCDETIISKCQVYSDRTNKRHTAWCYLRFQSLTHVTTEYHSDSVYRGNMKTEVTL